MSTLLPNLTFRVIRMPSAPNGPLSRFIAVAWNYDYGHLISTTPCRSYTDARAELDNLVEQRGCKLRWFDGEYQCAYDGDQITPVDLSSVPRETEDDLAHQA
jgi:hypothetical protein